MNFFHKSNTSKKVQIQEIFEGIERANLVPEKYFSVFSHIAELVLNVYHHSTSSSFLCVNWSLNIEKINNKLIITVSDSGQGIEESLKAKNIKNTDLNKLIEFAVEETLDDRGQGLRAIYDSVKAGEIHALQIKSSQVKYFVDLNNKSIDTLDINYQGVEAQLVVMLGEVS
ncbi:hypothetical protein [Pseudoalteromonas sp. T1lg24]|uniref:hypothetical protein n=1 Tax=Pseudoalteromonas sp. T1lg24 TaxID=2077099 RepID=UPI000CF65315|nr:hypothetical protein [Pseudoalteromonas sp. T1lg24]